MTGQQQPCATLQPFSYATVPQPGRVVIVPCGELDVATAPAIEHEARELCERGFGAVCLDLRELTFFDSSGLRLLIRLDAALSERGCRFSIVPGDGPAAHVLELTRTLRRFDCARG